MRFGRRANDGLLPNPSVAPSPLTGERWWAGLVYNALANAPPTPDPSPARGEGGKAIVAHSKLITLPREVGRFFTSVEPLCQIALTGVEKAFMIH
jgi:hypothetical protein